MNDIEKPGLRSSDWLVQQVPIKDAKSLIERNHYAKGCANTGVFLHGLFCRETGILHGVVWWMPPTRRAAESVAGGEWRSVLTLSRMAITPDTPRNACSFLLSKSVREIRKDGRFKFLVTYADESQGHDGGVYRACNWGYVGRTGPYPRWIDPVTGRQVSRKATTSRTKAEMLSLGYVQQGSFYKHKFVLIIKGLK